MLCHSAHEVSGQLFGVGFLLLVLEMGLNSSRLCGKCLYLLSRLAGLRLDFTWASRANPGRVARTHALPRHGEGFFSSFCPYLETDSAFLRPHPLSSGQGWA